MKILPGLFRWRRLAGLTLAGALSLLSGCAGVIPLPASSTKVEYGRQVKPDQVAFIRVGQTTKAEVVAALGMNYHSLPMERAIAFTWEMKGGGGIWWWSLVTPFGFSGADCGYWTGGWRAFFVAFDERGRVRATAFKALSSGSSLDEHLDHWVSRLPKATCMASTR